MNSKCNECNRSVQVPVEARKENKKSYVDLDNVELAVPCPNCGTPQAQNTWRDWTMKRK